MQWMQVEAKSTTAWLQAVMVAGGRAKMPAFLRAIVFINYSLDLFI
jgi:hypothetical protein